MNQVAGLLNTGRCVAVLFLLAALSCGCSSSSSKSGAPPDPNKPPWWVESGCSLPWCGVGSAEISRNKSMLLSFAASRAGTVMVRNYRRQMSRCRNFMNGGELCPLEPGTYYASGFFSACEPLFDGDLPPGGDPDDCRLVAEWRKGDDIFSSNTSTETMEWKDPSGNLWVLRAKRPDDLLRTCLRLNQESSRTACVEYNRKILQLLDSDEGRQLQEMLPELPDSEHRLTAVGGSRNLKPPDGEDKILVVGRFAAKWDGFKGLTHEQRGGVEIELKRAFEAEEQTFQTKTDSDGYFVVENVPPGGTLSLTRAVITEGTLYPGYSVQSAIGKSERVIELGSFVSTISAACAVSTKWKLGHDAVKGHEHVLSNYQTGAWTDVIKAELRR